MAYRQADRRHTLACSLTLNCSLGLSLRWDERWSQGDDSFILAGQHLHFKRKNKTQIRRSATVPLPVDKSKPKHDKTGTQEYSPLFILLSHSYSSLFPFPNLRKRLTLLIQFWHFGVSNSLLRLALCVNTYKTFWRWNSTSYSTEEGRRSKVTVLKDKTWQRVLRKRSSPF